MSIGINKDNFKMPSPEDLQTSEIRYRRLFEEARDGMLILNAETRKITDVNPFMMELLGYTREEFLGRELWEIGLLRDKAESAAAFSDLLQNGYIRYNDLPLETKFGARREVEFVSNVYEEADRPVIQCNIRDITGRRRVEAEIVELDAGNERQVRAFDTLLSSISDLTYTFDRELRFRYANKAVLKLYGKKLEELVGKNLYELGYPPEIADKIRQNLQQVLDTGNSVIDETRFPDATGAIGFYEYIFNPVISDDKNVEFVVGSARDVTERKRIEQIILESEEKYRNIVETASEGIWIVDLGARITYVNRQMAEMLGYTVVEMMGQPIFKFLFDEDFSLAKQQMEQGKGGESETGEFRLRRKDGSEVIVFYSGSPTKNQAGEITGVLGMITDITERKSAEQLLRHTEANYRNLVESSPAIVYLAQPTPPFSTVYVSPNVARFGYKTEEWFNQSDMWVSLIHEEDRERVFQTTETAMRQGLETDLEYRIVSRSGAIHWVHDRGRFVSDNQGNWVGWQGVMLDITDTKTLEEQLRQSQKLESVGLLAGGIAHDFNNMLTVINGYSDLALRRLTEDDPLRRNIEEIKKAGRRSAALTHQLLAFSRRQVLQPVLLDLNEIVTDTIKMLRHLIGEDIQLTTALSHKVGQVMVDPGQFSQIIMNLAVNARDAMPRGGKLTIETANIFLDSAYTRQHVDVLPGAYILLAVSDTGSGMSEEIKQHIFDPFFTTKEIGQGTGLGLATVYGIVKQSGGNIEVYSEEGIGTTFKIYLPRIGEHVDAVKTKDTVVDMSKGTETILLVEDEELVRNLTTQILRECGYTVSEAQNGVEAMELCEKGDCKYDLLMTDVVMPQMGGRELVEKLAERVPNLRILFTSGYTDDAVVRHGVIEKNTNFIQKPFTPEALARKIREILDDPIQT